MNEPSSGRAFDERRRRPPRLPPVQIQPAALELLHSHTDWRNDWTHIVPGRFSNSPHSGLLFYEQSTGVAEFWATDGEGGISLLEHHEGWRQSWTHIVPGFFGPSGFTGILLYDQAAGFGAFYDTNGSGGIVLLREHDNWRDTWTIIVGGRFTTSPHTGLLFYEQGGGHGEIYTTDGHGGIAQLANYDGWRMSWTQIVAAEFVNTAGWDLPAIDDLFFYEGSTGYCEVYQSDGAGGIAFHGSDAGLPPATHIVPGSFGGSGNANLLFYDRDSGTLTFRDLPIQNWVDLDSYVLPDAWDAVIPGNFWMADPEDALFAEGAFTDLLFYSQGAGSGRLLSARAARPDTARALRRLRLGAQHRTRRLDRLPYRQRGRAVHAERLPLGPARSPCRPGRGPAHRSGPAADRAHGVPLWCRLAGRRQLHRGGECAERPLCRPCRHPLDHRRRWRYRRIADRVSGPRAATPAVRGGTAGAASDRALARYPLRRARTEGAAEPDPVRDRRHDL